MVHEKTEKRTEEIIDVPGIAQYEAPPSFAEVTKTSIDLKELRTHRSPNWDGFTGIPKL